MFGTTAEPSTDRVADCDAVQVAEQHLSQTCRHVAELEQQVSRYWRISQGWESASGLEVAEANARSAPACEQLARARQAETEAHLGVAAIRRAEAERIEQARAPRRLELMRAAFNSGEQARRAHEELASFEEETSTLTGVTASTTACHTFVGGGSTTRWERWIELRRQAGDLR